MPFTYLRTLSAALAFYAMLSLAPLITIAILIAGLFLSEATISRELVTGTERFVSPTAAALVRDIIENSRSPATGGVFALIGFGSLLYAASRIFLQLRNSLDFIWGLENVSVHAKRKYRKSVVTYLISFGAALLAGLSLVGAMTLNALGATLPFHVVWELLSQFQVLAWLLGLLAAPLLYFCVFATMFKFLPSANVKWSNVWLGAALTAGLFWIGNYLIWLFLAHNVAASFYGAAGSIIIFLLWTYASAWIFLFGAKFTQVHAKLHGMAASD
ncbi:MAG: YihY/virulence factor BrkB family protein [Salaquimonas sp.]|nr:YihY/virulence factor BrkB family protein [Salaquimonas sp.]